MHKVYKPGLAVIKNRARRIRERGFVYKDGKKTIKHGPWADWRFERGGEIAIPQSVERFASIIVGMTMRQLCGTDIDGELDPWNSCGLPEDSSKIA